MAVASPGRSRTPHDARRGGGHDGVAAVVVVVTRRAARLRPLWVDPVAHAGEIARFERFVVAGPDPADCALFGGAIGDDGYGRNRAELHGWVAVAARDEAHYLEARIAKPPQRGDGIGPIHAGAALRCRCPLLPLGR